MKEVAKENVHEGLSAEKMFMWELLLIQGESVNGSNQLEIAPSVIVCLHNSFLLRPHNKM